MSTKIYDQIDKNILLAIPNPSKEAYEIKIRIKANQDFEGEIIETVPFTFAVVVVDFNAARSEAGAVGATESASKQDTPSPHGKPFQISNPVM